MLLQADKGYFFLGHYAFGPSTINGADRLWGQLDEFRVYNRSLSPQEILNTYNKTVTTIPNDLILYYNFDEAVPGSTVVRSCHVNYNVDNG